MTRTVSPRKMSIDRMRAGETAGMAGATAVLVALIESYWTHELNDAVTITQGGQLSDRIASVGIDKRSPSRKAADTARWAVTMTKVRIRRVLSRTRWQLVTFCGKAGYESAGIVDLLAVRKDHGKPKVKGMKRGDALQIVLIQVKGGRAAMPKPEDSERLR